MKSGCVFSSASLVAESKSISLTSGNTLQPHHAGQRCHWPIHRSKHMQWDKARGSSVPRQDAMNQTGMPGSISILRLSATDTGVTQHQVLIRCDIGTADLEDLPAPLGFVERGEEIIDHILNGDGLGFVLHPQGTWDDGKQLGHEANHFEGNAPRTGDHARTKFSDRNLCPAQVFSRSRCVNAYAARYACSGSASPPR